MDRSDDSDDFEKGEMSPLMTQARINKREEIRKAGIQRIQQDMSTVNQLYRDLSGIVIRQGETIDAIDGRIEQTVKTSKNTNDELLKSDQRYRQQQRLILRIIMFLIIAIIIVFLLRKMM
jgi:t-SNARE complex subunit (syntaxin)